MRSSYVNEYTHNCWMSPTYGNNYLNQLAAIFTSLPWTPSNVWVSCETCAINVITFKMSKLTFGLTTFRVTGTTGLWSAYAIWLQRSWPRRYESSWPVQFYERSNLVFAKEPTSILEIENLFVRAVTLNIRIASGPHILEYGIRYLASGSLPILFYPGSHRSEAVESVM